MDNVYIKSYGYKGSDVTLQLRTNTAEITENDPLTGINRIVGHSHSLVGAKDMLTTLAPIVAGSTGDTLTDASLDGLYVSAFDINGGDRIYTHDAAGVKQFTKEVADDVLIYHTGTFTTSDTVNVYYLDDADADMTDGWLESQIADQWDAGKKAIENEIDAVANSRLHNLMLQLGATLM